MTPVRTADGDARRDVAQYPVALVVPEGVVDLLEAVEVDEQHGHVDAFALTELFGSTRRGSASW